MNSRTYPKRTIALAAMAVGLCACAGHGNGPAEGGGDSPSGPSTTALQRIRGEVVVGKDGYGLTPCGGDQQRILTLSVQAEDFIDRFQAPAGKPEFFLDAWAREQGSKLEVVAVERAHTEGPRCDATLEQAQFVASGTEPFWSLRVAPTGWLLERPDSPSLQAVAAAEKIGSGYAWTSASPKAKVELTPGYCADGMADAASAWQARIELGDARLTGCAHRGGLPLP